MMNARYVWHELLYRRGRTLTAVISVALGVALFLSLQSYADAYREAARQPLTAIGSSLIVQREGDIPEAFEGIVFPHSTAPITEEELASIEQVEGVDAVSRALYFWSFGTDRFLVGLGIAPEEAFGPGRLQSAVREGRFLQADESGTVLADSSFAEANGLQAGDELTISGESFRIVGLVDTNRAGTAANANVYMLYEDADRLVQQAPNVRNLYQLDARVTNLLYVRADASKANQIAEQLRTMLGDKTLVTTPQSFEEIFGTTFQLVDRFALLVGLFCLALALISLMRVMAAGMNERKRDAGIMRAVGWTGGNIIRQMTSETVAVVFAGWGAGLAVAAGAVSLFGMFSVSLPVPWELSPTPHFMAGGGEPLTLQISLRSGLQFNWIAGSLALCIAAGWITSWQLARNMANRIPAEVLRSE